MLERCLIRTGARPKELCGLEWGDIRWAGWRTSAGLVAAKAEIPADRWKAGAATGEYRTIYFTPVLTRALHREHRRCGGRRHVFVHGRGQGGRGEGEPWRDGSVLSKVVLRVRRELIARQAEWNATLKSGGTVRPWEARMAAVAVQDDGPDKLSHYRWRHTAASTLLMAGVDVPTVAELLGTSPDMIYRSYGHILDGHLAAAAEHTVTGRRTLASPPAAASAHDPHPKPHRPAPAPRKSGPGPARSPRVRPP